MQADNFHAGGDPKDKLSVSAGKKKFDDRKYSRMLGTYDLDYIKRKAAEELALENLNEEDDDSNDTESESTKNERIKAQELAQSK